MFKFIKSGNPLVLLSAAAIALLATHKYTTGQTWSETVTELWETKKKMMQFCPWCM
jgi:hypothetical protein